jgi:hypothetical protein
MMDRDEWGYVPLKDRIKPLLDQGMRPNVIAHKLRIPKNTVYQIIWRIRHPDVARERAQTYYRNRRAVA